MIAKLLPLFVETLKKHKKVKAVQIGEVYEINEEKHNEFPLAFIHLPIKALRNDFRTIEYEITVSILTNRVSDEYNNETQTGEYYEKLTDVIMLGDCEQILNDVYTYLNDFNNNNPKTLIGKLSYDYETVVRAYNSDVNGVEAVFKFKSPNSYTCNIADSFNE
jgi:hypothetical protein